MIADLDIFVRVADLDPDSVGNGPGCRGDWLPVQRRTAKLEADVDLGSVRPAISRREVPKDAVVDGIALRPNVDRLGNLQRGVALDLHVADVPEDAFLGLGDRGNQRQAKGGQEPPCRSHSQAAGRAKATFGALWMLGSSSW